jgi:sulfide dehydrogenase cytochrome subunit
MTSKSRHAASAWRIRRIVILWIAAGVLVLLADRTIAANDIQGGQLAAMCASCHRLDGRDKGIPSTVGLDKERLAGAMMAFKSGERSSQIMRAVALSLSDGEIAALAEYLAAQPTGTKQR